MDAEAVAYALDRNARASGGGWKCRCPCHEDRHASLSLSEGNNGKIVWHCHAGCSQADVQAELQRRGLLDGWPNGPDHSAGKARVKTADWHPILPVPEDAPAAGFRHAKLGRPSSTWKYRDAAGRTLFHTARFDLADREKAILPRVFGRLDGTTGWHWKAPATPRPLYRLDLLAKYAAAPVLVVEGEKVAAAARKLVPEYVVVTWQGGCESTARADWSALKGRDVVIWPDNDLPGRKAANKIATALEGIAESVCIVEVPPLSLPDGWDLADELPADLRVRDLIESAPEAQAEEKEDDEGREQDLEQIVEQAKTDPGAPFEPDAADFLAALKIRDPAGYERAIARLKKSRVRVAALEKVVEQRQPEHERARAGLDLPEPEPWGEPVDGAELIAELVEQIVRYVILSEPAARATALWSLHTHAHDAGFHSPRLTVTSPTMRCGKSTLLRVLSRLVTRPLPAANITPSAMFRVIEAAKPTLLIDEADSFLHDNEELRGVVNSSHCRLDAYVVRNVATGDDYQARAFSTWAPIAIASIGKVAATIADRSITLVMERKAKGQTVTRMRVDRDDGFGVLASKAARWAQDHLEALRQADPDAPSTLNDRQADNWRPLLAIADAIGGDWSKLARDAALALSAADEDADTIGVQLLASIKSVFNRIEDTEIWTTELLQRLHRMSERPWGEYGRQAKPISAHQIATLLKPFAIKSEQIKKDSVNKRGFRRDQFKVVWKRYVSS